MCDAHLFQGAVDMAVSENIRRARTAEINERHKVIGIKVYLESMVKSWWEKLNESQVLTSEEREKYEMALEASGPAVAALKAFEAEKSGFWIDDDSHFQKLESLAGRLEEEWEALAATLASRFPADGPKGAQQAPGPKSEAGPAPEFREEWLATSAEAPPGEELPEGGWQPRWWQDDPLHELAFEGHYTVMSLSAPALERTYIDLAVVCGVEGPTEVVCKGVYFQSQDGVIPGLGVRLNELIEDGMPLEELVEEALVAATPFLKEELAAERADETRKALERVEKALTAQPFGLAEHDRLCSALYHLRACFAVDPEHAHYPEGVILERFPQLSEQVLDGMLAKGGRIRASGEELIEHFNRAIPMKELSSDES